MLSPRITWEITCLLNRVSCGFESHRGHLCWQISLVSVLWRFYWCYIQYSYGRSDMHNEEIIEIEFNRKKVRLSQVLRKISTRKLMQLHSEARAYGYCYPDNYLEGVPPEIIKAVLDKREHIPNKKESKAKRKEAIKSKLSKPRKGYIPKAWARAMPKAWARAR
jgi:hypothetical protein